MAPLAGWRRPSRVGFCGPAQGQACAARVRDRGVRPVARRCLACSKAVSHAWEK